MKMGTFTLQNPHKSQAGKERGDEGAQCLGWKSVCSKNFLLLPFSPPAMLANTQTLVIPSVSFMVGICGVGVHACADLCMCIWKSEPSVF